MGLATPLLGLFGVCVGFGVGIAVTVFITSAAQFWAFLFGPVTWLDGQGLVLLVYGASGAGYVAGGAACAGLAAWIARGVFKQSGQIAPGIRTAALGGGTAALLLGALVLLPTLKGSLDAASYYGPKSMALSALVGIPHLLLTCRNMARHPPALAAVPTAARRLGVALALLWGEGGALLLLTAHGRS